MTNLKAMIFAAIATVGLVYIRNIAKEEEKMNNQMYYASHDDGSEDIISKENSRTRYYLNLDGDLTIDRIVIFNDDFQIENILLRPLDYTENKNTFDIADKVLEEQRKKINNYL
ncbi:MAG: hypothetical protein Q8Q01_04020 [archaeon]|nr:hypothetical protein [archaeon]